MRTSSTLARATIWLSKHTGTGHTECSASNSYFDLEAAPYSAICLGRSTGRGFCTPLLSEVPVNRY
jgi:hypothetical protein